MDSYAAIVLLLAPPLTTASLTSNSAAGAAGNGNPLSSSSNFCNVAFKVDPTSAISYSESKVMRRFSIIRVSSFISSISSESFCIFSDSSVILGSVSADFAGSTDAADPVESSNAGDSAIASSSTAEIAGLSLPFYTLQSISTETILHNRAQVLPLQQYNILFSDLESLHASDGDIDRSMQQHKEY